MAINHLSEVVSEQQRGAVISGRFVPSEHWHDTGSGLLWVEGQLDDDTWNDLNQWLEREFHIEGPRIGSAQEIRVSGETFIEIVSRLGDVPDFPVSDELALYVHGQRLAMTLIEARDILAYAAPITASPVDVFQSCYELADIGEDGLGHWGSQTGDYAAAWVPAWRQAERRALRFIFVSLAESLWLRGWTSQLTWSQSEHGKYLVDTWIWKCIDYLTRQVVGKQLRPESQSDAQSSYRIMYRGEEEVIEQWSQALQTSGRLFTADGWLIWRTLRQFFNGSGWQQEWLDNRSGSAYYHVEFELVPPAKDSTLPDWNLVYWVVHNHLDVREPIKEWWSSPDRRWRIGLETLVGAELWFLPQLWEAAQVCEPIRRGMQSTLPYECRLSANEVFLFFNSELPALEEQGFTVRTPDLEAMKASDIRIRVQVKRIKGRAGLNKGYHRDQSWFDTKQLVDFDWHVAIGDEELSRSEFEEMVDQKTPFMQLGGTWRLVPIQELLEQVEEIRQVARQSAAGNLMPLARSVLIQELETNDPIEVEVTFDEGVSDVRDWVSDLLHAHEPEILPTPEHFHGFLREYQVFGFSWLWHLRKIGYGCILADDMGLGKTIQVLAYLLYLKEQQVAKGIHLLICPTSLIQNWRAEVAKFAPELKIHIHHGASRNNKLTNGTYPLDTALDTVDLVVTTYATIVRDADAFMSHKWDVIITDEAQNIKNPETKQAQAVRSLQAFHRVALTGTPVENRLEELWSIFQFVIPGYFGNLTWFRKVFVEPITSGSDTRVARQLHQLLKPVLLRRSKSDPAIQMELPEKWEVNEYAGLTSEQAALYQAVVNRLFLGIDDMEGGMSRRGQILTALVRLKQVCDHPCLTAGGSNDISRSGKLKLLMDLLDDVVLENESALIFTQFRDMGELLTDALQQRFGWRPKFLHGGLSAAARGEIVEDFQSGKDPASVLVLSLKAGGVGLNLTRANHVFHFDRWWNPAVEDQATDRAFRIGQTKDVQVHKLVCPGTLEERIDQLIQSKRQLSSAVVGESEGWITEMDNNALRSLFELDVETAVEDDD